MSRGHDRTPASDEPGPDASGPDDPVARNRATPARSTPGRTPVGADVTNRLRRITGAVLLLATFVLAAAIVAQLTS